MSNKYGDKVEAIKPPSVEDTVEEVTKVGTPVTARAQKQTTEPPRPNSNFSRTVEEAKPNREVKSEGHVKMAMTDYVLSMKDATTVDDTVKAQMKFYNLIRSILTQKDFGTFSMEWTSLLNFININKDDIDYISISRGVYKWPLDARQQKVFSTFALLALLSANPKTRRNPEGISGEVVLEHAMKLGKEASYNIGAYYTF